MSSSQLATPSQEEAGQVGLIEIPWESGRAPFLKHPLPHGIKKPAWGLRDPPTVFSWGSMLCKAVFMAFARQARKEAVTPFSRWASGVLEREK